MAIMGIETQGWSRERAEREIIEIVRRALGDVFDLAASEGITADSAAHRIAEGRLSNEMVRH